MRCYRLFPIVLLATMLSFSVLHLASAPPNPVPEKSWQGIYRTETTIGAKDYKSLLEIHAAGDDVWLVDGHCQGLPMQGVAQVVGDVLAIGWTQSSGPGITILRKKKGVITGQWAGRPGDGELRQEKWTLIPEKNMKAGD